MKLHIKTFGCQMNVHDSSRISELMEQNGYSAALDANQADVIVVNTCSVREKAWHKAVSEVGRMCALKRNRPEIIVAVTGCVAQQEGEKWFERIPNLDLVIGPDHYSKLHELIEHARGDNDLRKAVGFDQGLPADFLSTTDAVQKRPPSCFVTVMKGCSEKCNYCIVPSVRGPERFRDSRDIICEAKILVKGGAREIMLLGQKVNSYKKDGMSFAGLLEKLDQIPGLERLRFTSPHPRHMDVDLIASFGKLKTLCESVHLPVQSGSSRVLERMGRRYTSEYYRDTVSALRKACPEILISTDLIVGFSGETEDEFNDTLRLLTDVRFSGVFSFKYSPRPGTMAAQLPDDVPEQVKRHRLAEVHEVVARIEQEVRSDLVGKKLKVLVDGTGRNAGQLTGRARNNQIVNFISTSSATINEMLGKLVEVEVVRALPHCLEGSLAKGG
ncbi:MAG: tRNA (N6-isopentenyl adenosine(37)-C2)-methylthiotransferase MiaB [Proteobacteria bacterium]|nr:tRNA (N6-isopentenyl adenosine(37)-C2)-methylthiotransferase MiaB [Pseudomonadota bacterium]